MEFEQQDPPPVHEGAGVWKEAKQAAKAQPGVWLVAGRNTGRNNAGGVVAKLKSGGFDATQRSNADGATATVYVRWPA